MQDYRYGFIDGILFVALTMLVLFFITAYLTPVPTIHFHRPVVQPEEIKPDDEPEPEKGD